MMNMELFTVRFDEDRTRIDIDDSLMGVGIQFPSGDCYVEWNNEAYPEEERLEHPHISIYGSIADVEQGTGGIVEKKHTWKVTE